MIQAELRQKQVANAGQDQVPDDRGILAHLEVVHSQFRFAVLEQPFDQFKVSG